MDVEVQYVGGNTDNAFFKCFRIILYPERMHKTYRKNDSTGTSLYFSLARSLSCSRSLRCLHWRYRYERTLRHVVVFKVVSNIPIG